MYDIYYISDRNKFVCFNQSRHTTSLLYNTERNCFYDNIEIFTRTKLPRNTYISSEIDIMHLNSCVLDNLVLNKIVDKLL